MLMKQKKTFYSKIYIIKGNKNLYFNTESTFYNQIIKSILMLVTITTNCKDRRTDGRT